MPSFYVQYGCELSSHPAWLNFDTSPTLRLQQLPGIGWVFKRGSVVFPPIVKVGNIVRGLPLPDGSASGVYASHVLEHLSYDDFWRALENTRKLLKPNGIFRLIVPDLAERARRYLCYLEAGNGNSNDWFMEACDLGTRVRSLRKVFGNSAHLWMWDEPSMRSALERTGFVNARRCSFNDCLRIRRFLRLRKPTGSTIQLWTSTNAPWRARRPW